MNWNMIIIIIKMMLTTCVRALQGNPMTHPVVSIRHKMIFHPPHLTPVSLGRRPRHSAERMLMPMMTIVCNTRNGHHKNVLYYFYAIN